MIYLTLFWEFFKMGALTFGGGYAMIPFIQDTVISHSWMNMEELIDFIAVSESTPGAFAVNIATYIGSEVGGLMGSFVATLGLVIPPFLVIVIIAKCYEKFKENTIVKGAMLGLKSTVVGLIGATVVSVGISVLFPQGFDSNVLATLMSGNFIFSVAVFALSLFLMLYLKRGPALIIGISAAAGVIAGYCGLIDPI